MSVRTIAMTVQTGIAARDLLRCGPLARVLEHPDARVVLLTPGHRDRAFLAEFASDRVLVVPHRPHEPGAAVWRVMTRRWRYARGPRAADMLHRLEELFIPTGVYDDLFAAYSPSLVVSGDPLRPGDMTLLADARRRNVPSLGSVRSWDNLLKHLRTRPHALTVWNRINAAEAIDTEYFRAETVTRVGAPQMDAYFAPPTWKVSRDDFCHSQSLDPARPFILLATSSFTYESDQTYLVDTLLDAIQTGEIRGRPQIVLRLHPDDRVGRYMKYRHVPDLVLDVPESYFATLGWTMSMTDIHRMANLLSHAAVMVNFATTVTLESAVFDTPTLLVAYSDVDQAEMRRYVVDLHFKMHYKALVERQLVPVAWNRADLVHCINRYLGDASLYAEERRAIVREWVEFTDGESGRRLGDAILQHAGLEPPRRDAPRAPATSGELPLVAQP